jgi:hypothetical protein
MVTTNKSGIVIKNTAWGASALSLCLTLPVSAQSLPEQSGAIALPLQSTSDQPSNPVSYTAADLLPQAQFAATEALIDPIQMAQAEAQPGSTPPASTEPTQSDSGIQSPVLEKWRNQPPNVLEDIKNDPSFRTRVRLGLSYFPSTFDSLGWHVGLEDLRIGRTQLTVNADYQATFTGKRQAGGATLRYYLFPLGKVLNIAPVMGYRYLETPRYNTDGLEVGARLQLALSRGGAADLAITQTWVNPRQREEVGLTGLSFGYALTKKLRLSTEVQKQNSRQKRDTRFGIGLEWMF